MEIWAISDYESTGHYARDPVTAMLDYLKVYGRSHKLVRITRDGDKYVMHLTMLFDDVTTSYIRQCHRVELLPHRKAKHSNARMKEIIASCDASVNKHDLLRHLDKACNK
jgi:hypothetical protein